MFLFNPFGFVIVVVNMVVQLSLCIDNGIDWFRTYEEAEGMIRDVTERCERLRALATDIGDVPKHRARLLRRDEKQVTTFYEVIAACAMPSLGFTMGTEDMEAYTAENYGQKIWIILIE